MFYSFQVLLNEGTEGEYWKPVTLANIHQLEGFLSVPAKIRNLKGWGEES